MEVRCWLATPTVFVTRATGHLDEASIRFYAEHAERTLESGGKLLVFHDWLAVTGYKPQARAWLAVWIGRWNAQLEATHVLLHSPQVLMAATVTAMTFRRAIYTYVNEAPFLEALRGAIDASSGSPPPAAGG